MERDESAGCQGTEGDPEAQRRRATTQAMLDLGGRVGSQRRIDVPSLERAGVERPVDALQRHRRREHRRRVGDREQPHRQDRDDRGEQKDRPSPERIRQPAGRQFESEHDQALDREDDADLRQGQPA